ncbi:MAG: hypothetical protein AAF664_16180 [Planctomycetota bacterium]
MTIPSSGLTFDERIAVSQDNAARLFDEIADCRHEYPWPKLDEQLDGDLDAVFHIVGYGSLLNPDSARRTITNTPAEGHLPVLAYGAKRVFNYTMPDIIFDQYQVRPTANQRAALNTDYYGDISGVLTGRLLEIRLNELPALREREKGYHLDPVVYVPWNAPEEIPKIAYVFRADESAFEGKVYVDDTLLPYPPYAALCREGAGMVDPDFEDAFLDTSWLADRVTTLRSWLRGTEPKA